MVVFIGDCIGVGDLLGAVSIVDPVDRGVGAVSVLEEYLVLGTVPEVGGLGEDGVVLGFGEVFEKLLTRVVLPEPRCWLLEA